MAFFAAKIPQPETSDLLSALDALWIGQPVKKDTKIPPPVAHILMKLGDGIVMKDFVDILTNRLLNVKNPRGFPPFLYMRFRQRLYSVPNTSRHLFAFSPRFDIANHLHQIPSEIDTTEKLMEFVSNMTAAPFEADKPLWEMHVRTDFGPEQSGILFFRYHQAITDGQSMVQILCRDLLDAGDQAYQHIKPRFGGMTYASHFCQAVFMAGYMFFTDLVSKSTPDLNCIKYPEMHLSGRYEVFWSEPVNLSVMHRLKAITRTRFNDLLFTALAATLRTYCKLHGISTPADITACFPVDLRSTKGETLNDVSLGNRFVLEKIRLPVSQEAGMPRLWRVRDQMQALRSSYRHVALDFLFKILKKALSHRTLQAMWHRQYSGCTLLVNTLAAPEGQLTLQRYTLEDLLMWIPPPHGMRIPLAINVITCIDQVQLVVVADTGALKDAYWIAMDFPFEVMALGNLLKTRRVPETSKGPVDETDESSEHAVQQSLHALEERLVKIYGQLRQMRKKREIGEVPALWKTFELTVSGSSSRLGDDDDDASDSGSESDDESSSGSYSSGDYSSAGRTTEKKPKKKKEPPAAPSPAAEDPEPPRGPRRPVERRMSNKPMIFSGQRLSQPNTELGEEPVDGQQQRRRSVGPLLNAPPPRPGAGGAVTAPGQIRQSSLPRAGGAGMGGGPRRMSAGKVGVMGPGQPRRQ
ncbi:uncharacterized protein LOC129597555 [Paramacrobiotus metropolitanus]|uniref:uncharacterized protein LOC129597555 n=1 Tax=Paramacrobiotus metropolitanus TaxID=2943436 RepID=UPI00244616D0|nr:uncharacterized protein LOC129597555 [Paramacrobiotus metropolitanus]